MPHDLNIHTVRRGRKIDDGPKRKLEVQVQSLIERIEYLEGLVPRMARLEMAMQTLGDAAPKRPGRPKKVA